MAALQWSDRLQSVLCSQTFYDAETPEAFDIIRTLCSTVGVADEEQEMHKDNEPGKRRRPRWIVWVYDQITSAARSCPRLSSKQLAVSTGESESKTAEKHVRSSA